MIINNKGCGVGFDIINDEIIYCGDYNNSDKIQLCPSCKAQLSILTEYDKSIKEMIKVLKEVKKTFSDTKVECPICEEEKRLWVKDENMCYDCKIDEIFRGIR